MDIKLEKAGKRYRLEWIFRNLDFHFQSGRRYAIEGPNGSGKSTFLKILTGQLSPSKGDISFILNNEIIENDSVFKHVSIAGPYIELIEDFSLKEQIQFHQGFRSFLGGLDTNKMIELSGLSHAQNKMIRFFSSGMKQRLKLLLAICSQSELLLLDEPSTNLDRTGIAWYLKLLEEYVGDRTLIIASNIEEDFQLCPERIQMLDFKN